MSHILSLLRAVTCVVIAFSQLYFEVAKFDIVSVNLFCTDTVK